METSPAENPGRGLRKWLRRGFLAVLAGAGLWVLAGVGSCAVRSPRNDRDWVRQDSRQATGEWAGEVVTLRNIRDFSYDAKGVTAERWKDATYDLRQLRTLWFIVEPFAYWGAVAHTMFVFDFETPEGLRSVCFSVEARFEEGEKYTAWKGLWRNFEVLYLWGTEEDILGRRAVWLQADMFMFPVASPPENLRTLFRQLVEQSNRIAENAEFYHTLASSCTTHLVRNVNTAFPGRLNWNPAHQLPGLTDAYLWDKGLLAVGGPKERLRQDFAISEAVRQALAGGRPLAPAVRAALPKPVARADG